MKLRRFFLAALAVVLGITAQHSSARADCVDDCERAYGGYGTDESLGQEQECYRLQCQNAAKYGAIAFSDKNGSYGFSYDVGSAEVANRRALTNCTKTGEGCKLVISFSNSCASLAADANNRWATRQADTRAQAQREALNACGKGCDIKAWSCAKP